MKQLVDRDEAQRYLILIPEYMVDGVIDYIERGIEPGRFLSLIIQNDFAHAAASADENNRVCLFGWAMVLYNVFPAQAWGSVETMKAWMALRKRQVEDDN